MGRIASKAKFDFEYEDLLLPFLTEPFLNLKDAHEIY